MKYLVHEMELGYQALNHSIYFNLPICRKNIFKIKCRIDEGRHHVPHDTGVWMEHNS